MLNEVAAALIESRTGFVAALDQSGGSTRAALLDYGVADDIASDPSQMFDAMHAMRARVMRHTGFTGERVFAAILFERTARARIDDVPTPTFLARRGVHSLLKIDQGLEPDNSGARLMSPISDLDATLAGAVALGIVGTKARSVISAPAPVRIQEVVDQQFELAGRVAAFGLLPVLEPEVLLHSQERDRTEDLLCSMLLEQLDRPAQRFRVAIKLTLPSSPDRYAHIIEHPRVSKVLALSGGYSRREACEHLAKNHGVSASFSRALLQDLRVSMSDSDFADSLETALSESYMASVAKHPDA